MDKQNEKAAENNETIELTPDQMSMISGGASFDKYVKTCPICKVTFTNPKEYNDHHH